mmetsp:Transcript_108843/g.306732  ORF Transcript_108843/g.306732 Transcript_108843/m.306732 type:complete len:216 (+) Transcript_108843:281-928(+)
MKASTTKGLPPIVARGNNAANLSTTSMLVLGPSASSPAFAMLASAPALHSAACTLSASRSLASNGAAAPAFAAMSGDPAVKFMSAPAAYSFATTSACFNIAIKSSTAPPLAISSLTSWHLQAKFIIPSAASPMPSLSSAKKPGPGPADHTASHGPSSAASMANPCAACRFASDVALADFKMAIRNGIISGACLKPATTLALWSLKRLAMAPAARS